MNMERWFKEVTVPLSALDIAALCGTQQFNVVSAGASFNPGLKGKKGGLPDPQVVVDGTAGTEDEIQSMDDAESRDKKGQFAPPGMNQEHHDALKKKGYKYVGYHKGLGHRYSHANGGSASHNEGRTHIGHPSVGQGYTTHTDVKTLRKALNQKGSFSSAADEIEALLMAGHDVSGENRQGGKFAPGAKGPEATNSPLDPATGVKPPPAPHEIHKQNMDYHNKASKALEEMANRHLKLGKIALSPEDRQNHVNQARDMKQLASQHLTKAGEHAQKMSQAMQQLTQSSGAGNPGLNIGQPGGQTSIRGAMAQTPSAPKPADPLNQTQQMPAVKPHQETGNTGYTIPTGQQTAKQNQLNKPGAPPARPQLRKPPTGGPAPSASSLPKPAPTYPNPYNAPKGPAIVPPNTSDGEGTLPAASQQPGANRPQGSAISQLPHDKQIAHWEKVATKYPKGSAGWNQAMQKRDAARSAYDMNVRQGAAKRFNPQGGQQ